MEKKNIQSFTNQNMHIEVVHKIMWGIKFGLWEQKKVSSNSVVGEQFFSPHRKQMILNLGNDLQDWETLKTYFHKLFGGAILGLPT